MIPDNLSLNSASGIKLIEHPTYTYKFDMLKNNIRQFTDGLAAMEQMIYKALHTERYQYEIYDWNYGIELEGLFGKPTTYVHAELERRISECLLADDRITGIENFEFQSSDSKTVVAVKFTARTTLGDIPISSEVNLG